MKYTEGKYGDWDRVVRKRWHIIHELHRMMLHLHLLLVSRVSNTTDGNRKEIKEDVY